MTILRLCPQRTRDVAPLPDDAVLVNVRAGRVWLRSGEDVPVTNYFVGATEIDPTGRETELTAIVAGPTNSGEWITAELWYFEVMG